MAIEYATVSGKILAHHYEQESIDRANPIAEAVATLRKYCDDCRSIVQSENKRRFKAKTGTIGPSAFLATETILLHQVAP